MHLDAKAVAIAIVVEISAFFLGEIVPDCIPKK